MPPQQSGALQVAMKSKRRRLSAPPLYAIDNPESQLSCDKIITVYGPIPTLPL